MKQFCNIFVAAAMVFCAMLMACSNEEQLYEGSDYVMFSDTLNVCPVFQEENTVQVALSATKSVSYDRTFGVEVLQTKSNAIEGYHYTLESNTVTIPAGQLATSVKIKGIYENIGEKDSLNIRMRLISVKDVEWKFYGIETNVRLQKVCPFCIDNFTRYAVVESSFLNKFKPNASKRLIMTERVEGEENSVLLHDLFADGYDVKLTFDNSKPLDPKVSVHAGDIIGTTQEFISQVLGDNMLRMIDYTSVPSTFNACQNKAKFYSIVFVDKVGYLGAYYTSLRWISDAEAEDILESGF